MSGYSNNAKIAEKLAHMQPENDDLFQYLRNAYQLLVSEGLFASEELDMVEAWISDVKNIFHE